MTKKLIKIFSTQESNVLHIRFFPTDICNFNCSYCFPGSHPEKYRYPKNVNNVIKNFRGIFDFYSKKYNKTKFHLYIAGGGEPTIWPSVEQFCKEIKEQHDVYISIVTNGSRTLRWWEDNGDYIDDVVLSCHNEFVDIEHYVNVADLMFSKGKKVTALMLMDANHWDKCVSYIDRMQQSTHPWFIEAKAVVEAPGHGMDVYTQEQLDYLNPTMKRLPDSTWLISHLDEMRLYESVLMFDDNTIKLSKSQEIIVNGWNNFKGWNCNVSLESLVITADGTISGSCQAVLLGNNAFNVFSETFLDTFTADLELKPITCPLATCACVPETNITKSLN